MAIKTWINRLTIPKIGLLIETIEKECLDYILKGFLIKIYYGNTRRSIEFTWKTKGWKI